MNQLLNRCPGARIRLLALDVDDTLLTPDLRISPRNQQAIAEAEARGVQVILASGRAPAALADLVRILGMHLQTGHLIAFNGSQILATDTGKLRWAVCLDKAIMEEIWVWAEHFHLPVQTYVPQGIRVNYNNPWTRLDSELTGLEWRLMNRTEFMSETRAKIILPGEPTTLDKVEAHFKEVFSGRANMCRSKPYFFEIMHPVADKGLALERVSAWQGIPREDVMAIGDSWNDRGMLLWAGMGIAMANGEAGIRRIADWVTTRMHHEDGVAEAIDRFILNPGSRQGVRIID